MRISLRPNANFMRYTMAQDRKPPGAVPYSRTIEVGVTKEGETFAAGAAATERPKCIVTGGLATMSVTSRAKLPALLLGLPGRVQRQPAEIRQESRAVAREPSGKAEAGATRRLDG